LASPSLSTHVIPGALVSWRYPWPASPHLLMLYLELWFPGGILGQPLPIYSCYTWSSSFLEFSVASPSSSTHFIPGALVFCSFPYLSPSTHVIPGALVFWSSPWPAPSSSTHVIPGALVSLSYPWPAPPPAPSQPPLALPEPFS
jgi:hypothetical protein